jgi:hypothetical protein
MKKKWFSQVTPLAAIASLALTGAAWADFECSNATLTGEYAFGFTVLTTQRVGTGVKFFDGNGHLTQRDYAGNSVPAEFAPPGREKGTYTVKPDCTGSMTIDLNVPNGGGGVLQILFVISDGGRHIHEVVAEFTPPFSAGPVPVQTSADDWKVAPQQNQNNQ